MLLCSAKGTGGSVSICPCIRNPLLQGDAFIAWPKILFGTILCQYVLVGSFPTIILEARTSFVGTPFTMLYFNVVSDNAFRADPVISQTFVALPSVAVVQLECHVMPHRSTRAFGIPFLSFFRLDFLQTQFALFFPFPLFLLHFSSICFFQFVSVAKDFCLKFFIVHH